MTGHVAMIQQSSKKTDKKSKYHSPILATMIWPFLFSNFQIVLVDGSGWKAGNKEEQTSQEMEDSVSFYQTLLRCSDAPESQGAGSIGPKLLRFAKMKTLGLELGLV